MTRWRTKRLPPGTALPLWQPILTPLATLAHFPRNIYIWNAIKSHSFSSALRFPSSYSWLSAMHVIFKPSLHSLSQFSKAICSVIQLPYKHSLDHFTTYPLNEICAYQSDHNKLKALLLSLKNSKARESHFLKQAVSQFETTIMQG